MIRIDEIYSNTFWPWINKNIPLTRMFFCDPPGTSNPENLYNYGSDTRELNYILFHDQEPVHLDIHQPLFLDAARRNHDLQNSNGPVHSAIITSERNSTEVANICSQFNWKHYYYFFHGWAALDWYRGYNQTFLMPEPQERKIQKTFISPNRIVGGKRNHRLVMLYHIFKRNMTDNWISCPDICPAEVMPIYDCLGQLQHHYPDIVDVFKKQPLPMCFPGESDHPMHSCWLSLFDQSAECLLYLVTETVATKQRLHLTEKIFKPICLKMPFVVVGTQGSLSYLRSYGFKTFGDFWDESYDDEFDDDKRIEKLADVLEKLNQLTATQKQNLFKDMIPILEHNHKHFYQGNFEMILWKELVDMLGTLKVDFSK